MDGVYPKNLCLLKISRVEMMSLSLDSGRQQVKRQGKNEVHHQDEHPDEPR